MKHIKTFESFLNEAAGGEAGGKYTGGAYAPGTGEEIKKSGGEFSIMKKTPDGKVKLGRVTLKNPQELEAMSVSSLINHVNAVYKAVMHLDPEAPEHKISDSYMDKVIAIGSKKDPQFKYNIF